MRRTISKAAKAADVSVETIRFYERRGLVSQPMTPVRGYREYDLDTIEQIRFIRHAQEIGFSLSDIQELMELRSDPGEGAVGSCSILKEITKHESRPDYAVHSSSQTLKRSTLMKTTEFTVDGMHCDGCAKTAETLLSAVPGVRKAEVSYADRHARVLHDPDQASVTDLYAAVSRAGYVASDKSE